MRDAPIPCHRRLVWASASASASASGSWVVWISDAPRGPVVPSSRQPPRAPSPKTGLVIRSFPQAFPAKVASFHRPWPTTTQPPADKPFPLHGFKQGIDALKHVFAVWGMGTSTASSSTSPAPASGNMGPATGSLFAPSPGNLPSVSLSLSLARRWPACLGKP
ncbi:hypothetical protein S40293_10700 [Stachybotrys chartarum IBT 40293]|nr:hypothetical protein S40293_10700 [Stachybotrys chartarum IBT 40293]